MTVAYRRTIFLFALVAACGGSDEPIPDGDVAVDVDADSAGDATDDTGPDAVTDDNAETGPDDGGELPDSDAATEPDVAPDTVIDAQPDDGSDLDDSSTDTSDAATDAATDVVEPSGSATLRGRVVRWGSQAHTGIGGIRVAAGERETFTDADGAFELPDVPAGVVVDVSVEALREDEVYSSFHRQIELEPREARSLLVTLLPGCSATVNMSETDGLVLPNQCGTPGSIIGLRLPAGGVINAEGTPVSQVRIEMAVLPVDTLGAPTSDALLAFPGDMQAINEAGAAVYLESFGAAEVRLYDAATGERLQLADGQTATLQLLADQSVFERGADVPVPAWWYDPETGAWIEEGVMRPTVLPFVPFLLVEAEVAHFTWWNADAVTSRACVTGRAVDADGAPLVGAEVGSQGLSYRGYSTSASTADGRFSVFAREASDVMIRGAIAGVGSLATGSLQVQTALAAEPCVDVGDLVIDVAAQSACAQGRVVDAAGTAISGAEVVGFATGTTSYTTSGIDGTYCLPMPPGVAVEVTASGVIDGTSFRGTLRGARAELGSGVCTADPTTCAALDDLVVTEFGCLAGTVFSEDGVVGGAFVRAYHASYSSFGRTAADGTYCLEVERRDPPRVDVSASVRGVSRTASRLRFSAIDAPGNCGEVATCEVLDLALDGAQCVRGEVVDEAAEPVSAARVTLTDAAGRRRIVSTDIDGGFCVPAGAGQTVDLSVERVRDGIRQRANTRVNIESTSAICGSDTCADAGPIVVTTESFAACVTGRAEYRGIVLSEPIDVAVDGFSTSILPDERGVFCARIPLGTSADLSINREGECISAPLTSVALDTLTAGDCGDPASCIDAGDVDFADFCFFS